MNRNLYRFAGLAFFALVGGVILHVYSGGSVLPDENNFKAAVYSLVSGSNSGSAEIVKAPASAFVFAHDLYLGMRASDDVKQLQNFLTGKGFYNGPVTGNFFSLTLAAVKKMQAVYAISPTSGYVGQKTRAVVNDILAKAALAAGKASISPSVPSSAEASPPVAQLVVPSAPAAPMVFDSSLKIVIGYPSYTISDYKNQVLHEFKLQDGVAGEKVAIKRIKFKNVGTLPYGYIVNPRLINSSTGDTIGTADEGSDGTIEFTLTANSALPDNGFLVSGGIYSIRVDLRSINTTEKPYIILSIESAADVSAVDSNNFSKAAMVTSQNTFPIRGPRISYF